MNVKLIFESLLSEGLFGSSNKDLNSVNRITHIMYKPPIDIINSRTKNTVLPQARDEEIHKHVISREPNEPTNSFLSRVKQHLNSVSSEYNFNDNDIGDAVRRENLIRKQTHYHFLTRENIDVNDTLPVMRDIVNKVNKNG